MFFFQAEDGIRDLVRSRGLGDVYKRQQLENIIIRGASGATVFLRDIATIVNGYKDQESFARLDGKNVITLNVIKSCLLYTSDAADERSSVDLGGRRIIKK